MSGRIMIRMGAICAGSRVLPPILHSMERLSPTRKVATVPLGAD